MTIATPRHRLLASLAVLALGFAACGADETIEVGAPVEPSTTSEPDDLPSTGDEMIADPQDNNAEVPVSDGYTPMDPRTDLVSLQAATPDEVVVDPSDDARLLIHFVGAAQPCSGAAVTVTETDAEVIVTLETGLDPNAAAMSCIAQVFDYEIAIALDSPLGERSITVT